MMRSRVSAIDTSHGRISIEVAFGNLWRGQCHRISGAGHAPFWHAAPEFNAILDRFLRDQNIRCTAASKT